MSKTYYDKNNKKKKVYETKSKSKKRASVNESKDIINYNAFITDSTKLGLLSNIASFFAYPRVGFKKTKSHAKFFFIFRKSSLMKSTFYLTLNLLQLS